MLRGGGHLAELLGGQKCVKTEVLRWFTGITLMVEYVRRAI